MILKAEIDSSFCPRRIESEIQSPYSAMAPYYNAIYRSIVDYKGDCSFLERILRTHHKGSKVQSILDVGCGTGSHAFILARMGYEVTGIDVSRAMINESHCLRKTK